MMAARRGLRYIPYQTAILADSPVNYWRLNDSGPTAVDLGSAGKHGTFTAGITAGNKGMFCPVDNGLARGVRIPRGSGAENYINVTGIGATSASSLRDNVWSFECWIRPRNITSDTSLYTRVSDANVVRITATASGSSLLFAVHTTAFIATTTTGITDINRWHHIGVVSTDDLSATGELVVYLNGVALTNGTFTAPGALAGNTSDIRLGGTFAEALTLAEVAIYPTALTQAQFQTHIRAANLNYRPRKPRIGLHQDTMYEGSGTERTTMINNAAADGAKISRHTLLWDQVEATEGASKDWSRMDDVLTKSATAGIEPLLMFYRSPTWANGGALGTSIPTNGAAFTTFVGKLCTFVTAAVNRYKAPSGGRPRVAKWEIWNEPHLVTSWDPTPDAVQYVEMANAVRAAILAEDPTAEIGVGVLGTLTANAGGANITGLAFLDSCLTSGLSTGFTIFSIHPYTESTASPHIATAFNNNFCDIWAVIDSLKVNGYLTAATRLWVTETGWTTDSVSEANQALFIDQGLVLIRDIYSQWVDFALVFCDVCDLGGKVNFGIRGVAPTYAPKLARAVVLAHGTS